MAKRKKLWFGLGLVAVLVLAFTGWILSKRSLSGSSTVATEISSWQMSTIKKRFQEKVRFLSGFHAKDYGGGEEEARELDVYRIEPEDARLLKEQLDGHFANRIESHPEHRAQFEFVWEEARQPDLVGLEAHLPETHLPPEGAYWVGRNREGNRVISIGQENGFAAFATSRF